MDEATLTRFSRIAKTVALLAFFLPWVTISCAGQQIASASGVRLATGILTTHNPMTNATESHASSPNMAVLLAAAAIAIALLVSFAVSARAAATAGLACCGAAAALSGYAVLVDIPVQLSASLRHQPVTGDSLGSFDASMARMVSVDSAIGFWIAIFALAAACAIDWRVQRRRGEKMHPQEPSPP